MADRSTSQLQGDPTQRELSAGEAGAPDHRPTFGELLRRYRREAGLTQEALAERARLSARAIAALERGVNRAPRRDTLQLLAEALDLTGPAHATFEAAARWSGAAQARAAPGTGMVAPPGAPSTEPLASRATVPTNLPLALTSLVGRDQDVAAVRRLLGQTRLLTLTGAGGCGKTRLALEVARAVVGDASAADRWADGVWLVELAALGDGRLVPQAVASILGVRERAGQALLDSLSAFLQSRRVLLLLDNCEHLVATCAALAEALLRACPRLTILATSREALGVGGEQPWRVPSLCLPDPRARLSAAQVLASAAVQLFVQRAHLVRPEFAPRGPQVGLVAQVCRRLDGIPLAIELAAARLAVLPLEQVAARLDDRFRLLRGGSRTALPRQQTLRATLDWSYELLSPPERVLLGRMAVFAGGWTLEAAETVCAGEGLAPVEVLDPLAGLVAKSLVQLEEIDAGGRYGLLETVRQYGREKLMATSEAARVQDRHLDWYRALAQRAEPNLGGPEQEGWLARLEAELENLRAALAWSSREQDRQEMGLQLAEALRWFWVVRGHLSEGRRWLEDLLSSAGTAALRARAIDALGEMVWQQGDSRRALALFAEGFVLHTQAGNRVGAAHALLAQGMVTITLGDHERATALIDEALPLLGEQGERHGVAWALGSRAAILHLQGDYAGAAASYEESLALFRDLGDKYGSGHQLAGLAHAARDLGHHGQARRLYHESLQVFRDLLDRQGLAECFEGLAVMVAEGQPLRAGRLLAAAHGLREAVGFRVDVVNLSDHERTVADIQAALGEAAFAAAWAAGQALGLEKAIALALDDRACPS